MKKIMFNDKLGLTQSVLEGRKTQTRRITCNDLVTFNTGYKVMPEEILCKEGVWYYKFKNGHIYKMIKSHLPKYQVGEVVAVAQSYKNAGIDFIECDVRNGHNHLWGNPKGMKGWNNKMFVLSDLMPHQIRITKVHIQRLQNISDEDCLREGIIDMGEGGSLRYSFAENIKQTTGDIIAFSNNFATAKESFACLIDKVSGKGTWESNPYVWVYDFELIK